MSCMESKTVLRAEFPELEGKTITEVYPFYKSILGEADELEDYDGEVEYFSYKGQYKPAYRYENAKWGIDRILHHESDYKTYIEMKENGLSLSEFEDMANEMSVKFGVDKLKVRLISYSWYNGGDEPIVF